MWNRSEIHVMYGHICENSEYQYSEQGKAKYKYQYRKCFKALSILIALRTIRDEAKSYQEVQQVQIITNTAFTQYLFFQQQFILARTEREMYPVYHRVPSTHMCTRTHTSISNLSYQANPLSSMYVGIINKSLLVRKK